MADLTDEEYEAANELGRVEFETQPHAAGARYDRQTGLMTLDLYNGCSFVFPPRQLQGMAAATDEQLDAFELGVSGYALHWETLDADFTVPGLLAGQFGTRRFMEGRRAQLRAIYARLISEQSPPNWDTQAAE